MELLERHRKLLYCELSDIYDVLTMLNISLHDFDQQNIFYEIFWGF